MKTIKTVADMFLHRAEVTPDAVAYNFPRGESDWQSLTWAQTYDRVRAMALGLRALGIESEQRCAVLSSTRIEWLLADYAILCAGGATTTVYPSNTAEECRYIITDSGARVVFAENEEQVDKLLEVRDGLPDVIQVVAFEDTAHDDEWVCSLSDLEARGRAHDTENPALFDDVVASIQPEHLSTLIYTSGTTGRPKGVELTHDCWVYEGEALDSMSILGPDDHQYLWLPLSHSFGKVLQALQLSVGFATTVDGRIPKLVENLAVVRPTFMGAPPRIFEKVYNRIVASTQQAGGLKYGIFRWALGVGREVSTLKQQGRRPQALLALQYRLADRLVFSKLRERFGGRLRFFVSGSAPLSREMAEFFHAAGIVILEGYGLTESSAASFVNRLSSYKLGTVGPPLPGTEVRIAPEDGEVLIKSRGVMRGYHNLPDVTAETLKDGWLHTGDIGNVDDDGYLRITDRKKDLIKTSGGKYIAPQSLEGRLKALNPYIGQVLVHGDKRNYCSALIALDSEAIQQWAEDAGVNANDVESLSTHPDVHTMMKTAVDTLNAGLASYETIKKFSILPKEFTVEDGELTASMKLKRKHVEKKYQAILDGFYEDAMAHV